MIVDAPTVTAEGERAGEVLAASTLSFPAATLSSGWGAKENEFERIGSTKGQWDEDTHYDMDACVGELI